VRNLHRKDLAKPIRLERNHGFRSHKIRAVLKPVEENQSVYWEHGMSTFRFEIRTPYALRVHVEDDALIVELQDGRIL